MRETDSKEQIRENAERPYALSDERKIGIAKLKEFYAQEKKCLYCGEKFTPKAKNSTYCSHNCQKSDWRKRQLSDVIEKKQCVWCGKEFIPSRNDSMYCSQHCNAAAFRDRKRI
jgi:predicted nucleic acid-binding Zn ribbon protein